jgi:glucose/arabinose dehydrogenase
MRRLSLLAAACGAWACSSSAKPTTPPDSCAGVPASARVTAWTADPHFCLYRFASVQGARQLALAPDGELFVATNTAQVFVLSDTDGDGVISPSTERAVFTTMSQGNHGLAVTATHVYASSPTTIMRWPRAAGESVAAGPAETVVHDMEASGHDTRTLLIDGENRLYVNIGSLFNVEQPAGPDAPPAKRALIMRYRLDALPAGGYDASAGEVFAFGLRNEVGMALDAQGRLWGVENGRDDLELSDGTDIHLDNPAEEVNLFDPARPGRNYGYPFCWSEGLLTASAAKGRGTQHLDPTVMSAFTEARCQDAAVVVPPTFSMRAHLAPLGIVEYRGSAYPAEYVGNLFVTSHGSWNHIPGGQVGRMIMRLRAGDKGPVGPIQGESFLGEDDGTGKLLEGGWALRPVSIVVDAAGLLTFSDDAGGTINKIAYRP